MEVKTINRDFLCDFSITKPKILHNKTQNFLRFKKAKVAPLLARSNLLITRAIEWVNLVLGFEQEELQKERQT
ncbi:hypothetical protein P8452_52606 [Trifolium repens]|nr:hypothetical protein P8452_43333 [Trifolium repens]WJX68216.1 hypothetical protein P8452_52606 [Trifolium repens]